MFRKHGKMIVSVVAVAAMTAALSLTASAASNLPEIAMSAAIPATATVIDSPSVDVAYAADTTAIDSSVLVVKADGVDADVAYAADTTAVDGSVLVAKADGVNADVVFAGENNNPDAPIKIVFAEKTDGVIVTATDGIDLLQE